MAIRKVQLSGTLLVILGMGLCSVANEVWQVALFFGLIAGRSTGDNEGQDRSDLTINLMNEGPVNFLIGRRFILEEITISSFLMDLKCLSFSCSTAPSHQ